MVTKYYADFSLASGNNDGSDWANAYKTPSAVNSASFTSGDLIYLKEHSGYTVTTGFALTAANHAGVSVYGGFSSSLTGTSGTHGVDDTGVTILDANNSTSVVVLNVTGSNILLSKIKVKNSQAIRGGFQSNASVTLTLNSMEWYQNCTSSNYRTWDSYAATVTCNDCIWDGNGRSGSNYAGGGAYTSTSGGAITLNRCIIRNQVGGTADGVAVYAVTASACNLDRCLIYSNTSSGGSIVHVGIAGTIKNTIIKGNTGSTKIVNSAANTRWVNCTIADNTTSGANICHDGFGTISNSILWGNTGTGSPCVQVDNATVEYTDLQALDTGGLNGTKGSGCVDTNPYFLGTGSHPYKLSATTPSSVYQGASTGVTGYVDYDYLNANRHNTTPSMGAYEQTNDFVAAGNLTVFSGSSTFSNTATSENAFSAAGQFSLPQGSVEFSQVNRSSVVCSFPIPNAEAGFEQKNTFDSAAVFPIPSGSFTFNNAHEIQFTFAGSLLLPVGLATFTQKNPFTAVGSFPILEGSSAFEQENGFLVGGNFPIPGLSVEFQNSKYRDHGRIYEVREFIQGNATETLFFVFPFQWDPSKVTGVTVSVYDRSGVNLTSATDDALSKEVIIWPASELDAAATAYTNTITLDDGCSALNPGDPLVIMGSGGYEFLKVRGYDATTHVVTIDKVLKNSYSEGDAVYGTFGYVDLDFSGEDFSTPIDLVLVWTAEGVSGSFSELGVVRPYKQVELANFENYLRDLYPRAHDGLTSPSNRLQTVIDATLAEIRWTLIAKDPTFDISRMKDQSMLRPALAAGCAVNWTLNADEELADERKIYSQKFLDEIDRLSRLPIWVDLNVDDIYADEEDIDHSVDFGRSW